MVGQTPGSRGDGACVRGFSGHRVALGARPRKGEGGRARRRGPSADGAIGDRMRPAWVMGSLALLLACAMLVLSAAPAGSVPGPLAVGTAQALKVIKSTVPEGATAQGRLNRLDEEESDEIGTLAADKPDGVYYGTGDGFKSDITVAVTVKDGKVANVEIVAQTDDQSYFDHAQKIVGKITTYQRLNVHTMTGATYSSKGILAAVENALGPDARVPFTSRPWFAWTMVGATFALLVSAGWFTYQTLGAKRRADRAKASRRQRLSIQLVFFVVAPSAFASALAGVKYFFSQIHDTAAAGIDLYYEMNAFIAMLIALVAFTVAFGRFFCGYACSFGLYEDLLFAVREAVRKRLGVKRWHPSPGTRRMLRVAETALRGLKYVVLVGICVAVYLGFSEFLNDNSPWVVFAQLTNLSARRLTLLGVALLALVTAGCLVKERFFCEFLCPMGAVFSILPVLPTGRMGRIRSKCRAGCSSCRGACPVNVEPSGRALAWECLDCGRCIDACPASNVAYGLEAALREHDGKVAGAGPDTRANEKSARADGGGAIGARPERPARRGRTLLGRPAAVMAIALLLLAVLWAMGAARFLP